VGRDPDRNEGVPPPYWLASELGIVVLSVEYDEGPEQETNTANDEEDDAGLVVKELNVEEDDIVQLMDHLSTFDDS
jgi:hypothetical protein